MGGRWRSTWPWGRQVGWRKPSGQHHRWHRPPPPGTCQWATGIMNCNKTALWIMSWRSNVVCQFCHEWFLNSGTWWCHACNGKSSYQSWASANSAATIWPNKLWFIALCLQYIRHQGLNIFRILDCHRSSSMLSRCLVVAKIKIVAFPALHLIQMGPFVIQMLKAN